jgi:molybdopterin-dependent oxidoreductase alpha subunit
MGIWERPPAGFLDALAKEFGFEPPREHGYDAVSAVQAMLAGRAKVFFGMGGNFVSAMSDTLVVEEAMRGAALTVHVSTKLNRSHVAHGADALILPALGRSERDRTGGRDRRVTVEDSMSAVHASRGPLKPASEHLKSEVDIVCSMAEATLADRSDATAAIPWDTFRLDYGEIRRRIARVVPGCEGFDEKVNQPGGFVLPHPPRDSRTFPTPAGLAVFTATPLSVLEIPEGHLLLQTFRSHDQFNTTIYDLNDRYRGITGGRRVVFVSPADIERLGFTDGSLVDIISEWEDGSTRSVPNFRIVAYEQPEGCAAAYYPETNPLVPLAHTADGSNQPAFKSIVVKLRPASDPARFTSSDAGTFVRGAGGDGSNRVEEDDLR